MWAVLGIAVMFECIVGCWWRFLGMMLVSICYGCWNDVFFYVFVFVDTHLFKRNSIFLFFVKSNPIILIFIVSSRCRFNHLDPITALLLTRTNLLFFYSIIFLNVSLFYIIIFFHLDRPRENVFFL